MPDAQTAARGVEIRLLRRLSAVATRLRGRVAGAGEVEIAYFAEASRSDDARALRFVPGRGLDHDRARCRAHPRVRRLSERLVTIGACATAGGIQALRNFADVKEFAARLSLAAVYQHACDLDAHLSAMCRGLRAARLSDRQGAALEVINAFIAGRKPAIGAHSVCIECKQRGVSCVMVAHGTPCLGPVTRAGCGALCPSFNRGCYGCFGPMEAPNTAALAREWRSAGRAGPICAGIPELQRAGRAVSEGERGA